MSVLNTTLKANYRFVNQLVAQLSNSAMSFTRESDESNTTSLITAVATLTKAIEAKDIERQLDALEDAIYYAKKFEIAYTSGRIDIVNSDLGGEL